MGRVHTHARLSSPWCRSSLRTGLALAAAVAVALATEVPHAFWVALGALSVLRTSALSTGENAAQAVLGTAVGFVVAAPVVVVVEGSSPAGWAAFVIAVFAATAATGARLAVGQAGFTVFVVVLFTLQAPDGLQTAVVHVQDVALGALVAVVVAVVL